MLRELTPVAYADENDIVRYHQTDNIPSEEVLDNWIIAGIVTPAQRAASLGQRPHERKSVV